MAWTTGELPSDMAKADFPMGKTLVTAMTSWAVETLATWGVSLANSPVKPWPSQRPGRGPATRPAASNPPPAAEASGRFSPGGGFSPIVKKGPGPPPLRLNYVAPPAPGSPPRGSPAWLRAVCR